MPRNHRSAKAAGTRTESLVAAYLRLHVDDCIERRAKTGGKDRGDLSGFRHLGQRIVVEVKDTARWTPGTWITEAEIERLNDQAGVGMVMCKRVGHGQPGDQLVMMTVRDLVSLVTGQRPE